MIEATSRECSGAKWTRKARSRIVVDLAFLTSAALRRDSRRSRAEGKRRSAASRRVTRRRFGDEGVIPFSELATEVLRLQAGLGEGDRGINAQAQLTPTATVHNSEHPRTPQLAAGTRGANYQNQPVAVGVLALLSVADVDISQVRHGVDGPSGGPQNVTCCDIM